MRTLLIYTTVAGGGQAPGELQALAERLGAELAAAAGPGGAETLARQADGYDCVVAAGGDGTVHEVVNGLMAHPTPPALGLLPRGTGNDVARNLGLLTVDQGLAAVAAGAVRRIDLIRLELHVAGQRRTIYGVLNCGIGLGAAVVRLTTPLVKRVFGRELAYTVGTLRALAGWRSPVTTVVHDQGVFEGRVLFLAVGNGEYESAGTMRLSPGARMDDGVLNVLLIRHGSKLDVLRNFTKIATGEHIHHHLVDYFPTTRLEVTCAAPLEVQADGDVRGSAPVTLTVAPAALAVLAPPEGG